MDKNPPFELSERLIDYFLSVMILEGEERTAEIMEQFFLDAILTEFEKNTGISMEMYKGRNDEICK